MTVVEPSKVGTVATGLVVFATDPMLPEKDLVYSEVFGEERIWGLEQFSCGRIAIAAMGDEATCVAGGDRLRSLANGPSRIRQSAHQQLLLKNARPRPSGEVGRDESVQVVAVSLMHSAGRTHLNGAAILSLRRVKHVHACFVHYRSWGAAIVRSRRRQQGSWRSWRPDLRGAG